MSLDSSAILGVPELAGMQISRLGTYKATLTRTRVYSGAAGTLGGSLVWSRLLRKKLARERELEATSTAPQFGSRAYLALTEEDLALIKADVSTRVKLEEVLIKVPRRDVSSAELGSPGGPLFSIPLTITFTNGERWLFEVPRVVKGRGKKLVAMLAA
jgi:hypothetical protein